MRWHRLRHGSSSSVVDSKERDGRLLVTLFAIDDAESAARGSTTMPLACMDSMPASTSVWGSFKLAFVIAGARQAPAEAAPLNLEVGAQAETLRPVSQHRALSAATSPRTVLNRVERDLASSRFLQATPLGSSLTSDPRGHFVPFGLRPDRMKTVVDDRMSERHPMDERASESLRRLDPADAYAAQGPALDFFGELFPTELWRTAALT